MSRRNLTPSERNQYSQEVYYDFQQAQYIHPGGYTNQHIPMADATVRFIGVPPVAGTQGHAPVMASNGAPRPSSVRLYRDSGNDYWLRFDTAADTRYGSRFFGGVEYSIPINPDVKTISWVSTINTSPLFINFGWGAP